MNTLSYKTQYAKNETIKRKWYIVDAEGEVVGRLASKIAHVLKGKHTPAYTPHMDSGDNVIVINADKIRFTGLKMEQKEYITFSGHPGGQKKTKANMMAAKKPTFILEKAVKGMLPKNTLGRAMFRKLFAYEGTEHPHQAQKPQEFNF